MSIDTAELAQIQALAANLAAEPAKTPVSQYASEEDIADVAEAASHVFEEVANAADVLDGRDGAAPDGLNPGERN